MSRRLPPIHPGEILLEEFIVPRELNANKLALDLHIPSNRITEIIRGRRAISADTALRLARYFGTSAELWIGLQADYDLRRARDDFGVTIEREVRIA
ncbi:MAG TPA: HigA family addiction module antitoxin [Candidatus Dormibacteraeota bacterium]|nr:HigA family addiction module antitoxin [Candidatus Dormibacteraeota bacterium]